MTHAEWLAEARRRFGDNVLDWRFVCPSCDYVAGLQDWQRVGAPPPAIAVSCVGRWPDPVGNDHRTFKHNGGPCSYMGGGLIDLNPVEVVMEDGHVRRVFAFAEPTGGELK